MTIYHTSLLILLSGTSGTGKSTLSNMLGATIKNSKLMSTDAFRQVLRCYLQKNEDPLVFASTFECGKVM